MKIYTYGIIDSNNGIDESINGLERARVYNIPYRDIGIVASNFTKQTQDITKNHVLKHEEVVERLMENFTILPLRFLTVFYRKEDILSVTKNYYSDFRKNLNRLHNKVEFGLKVIWHGDTIRKRIINAYDKSSHNTLALVDSPAKSFIKEKFENYKIDKKLEKEADRYIGVMDSFLGEFASEKKLERLKSKNLLLSAAYLVKKERQGDFKEAFKRLRNAVDNDLKYLFSGPWPPYNFIILAEKPTSHNFDEVNMLYGNVI